MADRVVERLKSDTLTSREISKELIMLFSLRYPLACFPIEWAPLNGNICRWCGFHLPSDSMAALEHVNGCTGKTIRHQPAQILSQVVARYMNSPDLRGFLNPSASLDRIGGFCGSNSLPVTRLLQGGPCPIPGCPDHFQDVVTLALHW